MAEAIRHGMLPPATKEGYSADQKRESNPEQKTQNVIPTTPVFIHKAKEIECRRWSKMEKERG